VNARVRIDKQLVVVEAMTFFRFVGTVNAVAVNRTRLEIWNVAVKDFVGVFGQVDALPLFFAFVVEEAELDARRVRGKQSEVDALSIPPRSARKRIALADVNFSALFH
jgi:hypothetical protein